MRTTLPLVRTRRVAVLYAGVALFALVAALTARSVWRAWQERAGQARTAAVFELVQQRMPSRPIEAPGAIAWLRDQLGAYRHHLGEADAAAFARLAEEGDVLPRELTGTAEAMRAVAAGTTAIEEVPARVIDTHAATSLRAVTIVSSNGTPFVVTRRRTLDADAASNRFVARVVPRMRGARDTIGRALQGVARPVRLYALAEDGTLVSLPWSSTIGEAPGDTARAEALQLSSRPTLPSFAPEEFFFRFGEGDHDAIRYSGFYLDLGGRGLVSTLTMPMDGGEQAGVLALDLTHAVDWDHFASTIAAPLAAAIVRTTGEAPATWTVLQRTMSTGAPAPLRQALDEVVRREGSRAGAVSPITHAVVPQVGAVAAFQVAERAWLLTFFPSVPPSFPSGAVALLGVVLVTLLAGFEVNRRKAEREADRAARALGEKQNLLNTMQVPLMVVDPNTDEIVSANQAAESLGILRGARFADHVSTDPRAREHYERTQVATSEARRAYGVPIRVASDTGEPASRFAIVRSVAVTAPIEALHADERHRLAILFVLEPQSDLRLLLDDVRSEAHTDERRRLAGLLSHGLDSLAEVLRRALAHGDTRPGLSGWLAEYLQRRIHVIGWLLDHWHESPPPHDSVVDAAQAHETIGSLERIFEEVRNDRDLRSRLGWANGPLSHASDAPPFEASIDWPDEFETTLPVRGGLGFFLTEVLSNAMRHGAPGTRPRLVMSCDRVTKELDVIVENERRADRLLAPATYGGLALLTGMARLFGWREFAVVPDGTRFVVSWRIPLTRRDAPGKPD
jgi:hypothetical protein